MEGDDVNVALAENEVGPLGLLGKVDAIEIAALAVDDGFGGVHILGLALVQHPAAEGHHISPHVNDREHEPGAEFVIEPALLVAHHQSRGQQIRLGVALLLHGGEQAVPAVQGGSQAEVHGGLPADLPAGQIVPRRPAGGGGEVLVEPAGRVLVQRQHPLAAAGLLPVRVVRRDLHVHPLGQQLHRVPEAQVLDLHDEVDHPAALAAAEAVVHLLVLGHGEGACPLVVEGTQAKIVPALLGKRHVGGDHIDNIVPAGQLVQKLLGKRHQVTPPHAKFILLQYTTKNAKILFSKQNFFKYFFRSKIPHQFTFFYTGTARYRDFLPLRILPRVSILRSRGAKRRQAPWGRGCGEVLPTGETGGSPAASARPAMVIIYNPRRFIC